MNWKVSDFLTSGGINAVIFGWFLHTLAFGNSSVLVPLVWASLIANGIAFCLLCISFRSKVESTSILNLVVKEVPKKKEEKEEEIEVNKKHHEPESRLLRIVEDSTKEV